MNEEEKKAIERIKEILTDDTEKLIFYKPGLEDIKIILNLIENQQKEIESWKRYSDELEEKNTEISNKKCELEFEMKKQQKEIERRKSDNKTLKNFVSAIFNDKFDDEYIPKQKIKDKIEEINQKNKI